MDTLIPKSRLKSERPRRAKKILKKKNRHVCVHVRGWMVSISDPGLASPFLSGNLVYDIACQISGERVT